MNQFDEPTPADLRAIRAAALKYRRSLSRWVVDLGREIGRARAAEDAMPLVLKLHTAWSQLCKVEETLQALRGVAPEHAGVWPAGSPSPASPVRGEGGADQGPV